MIREVRSRRVLFTALGAALTVVAVIAGVVAAAEHDTTGPPSWQPPPPTLHGDLAAAPVTGWRANLIDMFGDSSPIKPAQLTIPSPTEAVPYLGELGQTAFFVVKQHDSVDTQWWLVAVNTDDGQPAFPPVSLNTGSSPLRCFLNIDSVLCLHDRRSPVTASIIDARSGRLSYEGPTDLRADGARLAVHQMGFISVATTQGQGVFGIGAQAATTWFVPGDGDVPLGTPDDQPDIAPILTTQSAPENQGSAKIVFSIKDGHVVTPRMDDETRIEKVTTYPGGFAAEVVSADSPTQVQLFDDQGRRLSDRAHLGRLNTASADYPIVEGDEGNWSVFAPDGTRIFEGDGTTPRGVRVIGDLLLANLTTNSNFPEWQQYNWRTGTKGKACNFDMIRRYRGSDGAVGVFAVDNPGVGVLAKGRSLSSCEELWSLPKRPDSSAQIWRIDHTLVQTSDDGQELISLSAIRGTSAHG
jgi:hypothetical protein